MKNNIIQEKNYGFALKVVRLSKNLQGSTEYILSKQLLRSGTSIGANVEEALAGQSRKDFISKMSIALKESRETRYWLRLLQDSKVVDLDYSIHIRDVDEIIRILSSIVKTTKENKSEAFVP